MHSTKQEFHKGERKAFLSRNFKRVMNYVFSSSAFLLLTSCAADKDKSQIDFRYDFDKIKDSVTTQVAGEERDFIIAIIDSMKTYIAEVQDDNVLRSLVSRIFPSLNKRAFNVAATLHTGDDLAVTRDKIDIYFNPLLISQAGANFRTKGTDLGTKEILEHEFFHACNNEATELPGLWAEMQEDYWMLSEGMASYLVMLLHKEKKEKTKFNQPFHLPIFLLHKSLGDDVLQTLGRSEIDTSKRLFSSRFDGVMSEAETFENLFKNLSNVEPSEYFVFLSTAKLTHLIERLPNGELLLQEYIKEYNDMNAAHSLFYWKGFLVYKVKRFREDWSAFRISFFISSPDNQYYEIRPPFKKNTRGLPAHIARFINQSIKLDSID